MSIGPLENPDHVLVVIRKGRYCALRHGGNRKDGEHSLGDHGASSVSEMCCECRSSVADERGSCAARAAGQGPQRPVLQIVTHRAAYSGLRATAIQNAKCRAALAASMFVVRLPPALRRPSKHGLGKRVACAPSTRPRVERLQIHLATPTRQRWCQMATRLRPCSETGEWQGIGAPTRRASRLGQDQEVKFIPWFMVVPDACRKLGQVPKSWQRDSRATQFAFRLAHPAGPLWNHVLDRPGRPPCVSAFSPAPSTFALPLRWRCMA
jgi:hypothetical protein